MLVFKSPLLVELGHAVVTIAAVELQAIWCAMVLGEVAGTLLPGVAPFAILVQMLWSWCSWLGLDTCTGHARNVPKGVVYIVLRCYSVD